MKYNSNSGYISDINRLTPQVTWCMSTCTRMFCINNIRHSVILRLRSQATSSSLLIFKV